MAKLENGDKVSFRWAGTPTKGVVTGKDGEYINILGWDGYTYPVDQTKIKITKL